LSLTSSTGDEVVGVPYGQSGSKVEVHPTVVTFGAGNLLESERYVRLGSEIELHVGMDGKRVEALLADAPPVAISSHESFIDAKARLLTDGAWDRVQPPFHFLLCERDHAWSIAGEEKKSQPVSQSG
jgi:hypothetical protein